jgi:hypothetical protein
MCEHGIATSRAISRSSSAPCCRSSRSTPTRRSHHYADALSDVRLKVLNLSHFLGLDRRLPDTSSRDLARVLWKAIDQFIETAQRLEPIRNLSDAHARNVATAFAEASTALSAAADVNVPDAGSIFDDHN